MRLVEKDVENALRAFFEYRLEKDKMFPDELCDIDEDFISAFLEFYQGEYWGRNSENPCRECKMNFRPVDLSVISEMARRVKTAYFKKNTSGSSE
ncbi:MAG: hypothetical protein ACYS47_02835 [Planctomycetota bacterium]|jgi:hypothetical protein